MVNRSMLASLPLGLGLSLGCSSPKDGPSDSPEPSTTSGFGGADGASTGATSGGPTGTSAATGTTGGDGGGTTSATSAGGAASSSMGEVSTSGTSTATTGGATTGATTAGGTGAVMCDGGLADCAGSCVDLMTSDAHCGACNSACVGGRACVAGACQCPDDACPELPAFPGADGAAANVSGGRGGDVYHVTQLDSYFGDMAPGTLRYGLSNLTGPRTIVFDVSGVFSLGREPVSGWDSNGNGWDTASRLDIPSDVTLAGQTAPGPVIIMGGVTKPGGSNIIIRNIVFAPGYGTRNFSDPDGGPTPGDFPDAYVFDALDISGQGVMIDHVTTVYATDETISLNEEAADVTIQFSNISQGQNYPQADAESDGVRYTGHALGSLLQAGSSAKVSILHNLYAHQKGRLPRVGTEADALSDPGVGAFNDFRNNVFYNWFGTAGTGASGQPSQNNFVGNFYLAGPGGQDASGGESTAITTAQGGTSIFDGNDSSATKVYHSGNVKDTNRDGDTADVTPLGDSDFSESSLQTSAFTEVPYYGMTSTAEAAFDYVLDHVGAAYWNRTSIDARLVSETRAGTGRIVAWADDPFDASANEGTEWRALVATASESRPAGFDTDLDGMPDSWESEHSLDPNTPDNNGDFDGDGYTNLEEYLNELAAWPAPAMARFTGRSSSRYADLHNWTLGQRSSAHWQPSRFDVAHVGAGSAVVDAPGQHAGVLEIAGERGLAKLLVTAGSLRVARELRIGNLSRFQSRGVVEQSGGRVLARGAVVLGASALYRLEGGRLDTPRLSRRSQAGRFELRGGTLSADLIAFSFVNRGGTLTPGADILEVAGDLTLASGALELPLGPQSHAAIKVRGRLTLGGSLVVALESGFAPEPGEAWMLAVAAGGIAGSFQHVPAGYRTEVVGDRLVLIRAGELRLAELSCMNRF